MSAFEAAYAGILEAMSAGSPGRGGGSAIERFSRVLEDYLNALAADPALARVFLIEVYAAGPTAIERRLELQRQLVDAVAGAFGLSGAEARFTVEAYLAAVVSLVTARLAVDDVAGLRDLHAPLVALARRLGLDGVSN